MKRYVAMALMGAAGYAGWLALDYVFGPHIKHGVCTTIEIGASDRHGDRRVLYECKDGTLVHWLEPFPQMGYTRNFCSARMRPLGFLPCERR